MNITAGRNLKLSEAKQVFKLHKVTRRDQSTARITCQRGHVELLFFASNLKLRGLV